MKRLSEIGVRFDASKMSAELLESFDFIASELAHCEAKEREKQRQKSKAR